MFLCSSSCLGHSFKMEDSYYYNHDVVLDHFQVKADIGLDPDEVNKRREKYGWNGKLLVLGILIY